MRASDLEARYAIPGAVSFEEGPGGLVHVVMRAQSADARMTTHGAHLLHWQPAGQQAVLFLSKRSWQERGKPIRGGVPVCWPWFGRIADRPDAPQHGFARLREWEVASVALDSEGRVAVAMELRPDDAARALWPHDFLLRHTVTVGRDLDMVLETRNTGTAPFRITEALHTYFLVSDVTRVSVAGLQGARYLDEAAGFTPRIQREKRITIAAETDRCYQGTTAACVLEDPIFGRRITIKKLGSRSTVVWNPWAAKAKAMPDFGDDEYRRMLCIETANAMEDAVLVPPGGTHRLRATIAIAQAIGGPRNRT